MTLRALPSFRTLTIVFACAVFTGRVAAQGRAGDAPTAGEPSLESLAGDYQNMGQLVQVRVRADGVLTIVAPKAVPPEPVRELQPLGNWRFAQKGLSGNSVEFMRDHVGNVTGLMLHGPYGSTVQSAHERPSGRPWRACIDTGSARRHRQAKQGLQDRHAPATPARPISAAPAGAAGTPGVQPFVHRALGFSLDIPADWTVRETESGFQASQGSGGGAGIGAVTVVEPRSRTLREQFHEGREAIGRGETTIEFLPHPQGDAVLRVNRTIARVPSSGDMTMLSYDFYLDVGDKRWTFHCGDMLKGAHPSDHIQACLTAARTFRVRLDSPVTQPSPGQTSASGQGQRVTLIEGPSFEFPQTWRVTEQHGALPGAPSRTVALSAGNGDVILPIETRVSTAGCGPWCDARRGRERHKPGCAQGSTDDFEAPGVRGFAVHDAETGSVQEYWYHWVSVNTTVWAFECTEMAITVKGQCESAMRTFRNRSGDGPCLVGWRWCYPTCVSGPFQRRTNPLAPLPLLPVKEPPPSTRAPAALIDRLSSDPGVNSIAPDQRNYAVKEAAAFYDYCDTNYVLSNFSACDCMAQAMLQARLRVGFETVATTNASVAQSLGMKTIPQEMKTDTGAILREMVAGRIDTLACIAPQKVAKWASERARRVVSSNAMPEQRAEKVLECVGESVVQAYQAKPALDVGYIDRLLSQELDACIRKIPM